VSLFCIVKRGIFPYSLFLRRIVLRTVLTLIHLTRIERDINMGLRLATFRGAFAAVGTALAPLFTDETAAKSGQADVLLASGCRFFQTFHFLPD
jgi:hypothetical protein